jgi:riboflavin kinase/FMN adenylyltransferase
VKISQDRANLAPASAGAVVSIGVFDGVHLGHQSILRANVAHARSLGTEPTVVTFQGHPKELILGRAPRTLTSLEHRLDLFARAGIEHTLALPFDKELRHMPWGTFVAEICVAGLGAKSFVLGFDSKFGQNRGGTPGTLADAGFRVEVAQKVLVDGRAISSTAIREAVDLGDLDAACRMLGRPVTIFGKVVEGDRIGRTMGFPTANLDPQHDLHPPTGVYACRVRIPGESEGEGLRGAVTNIGFRPTLNGEIPAKPRLEVHLLDWTGDLYGKQLEVQFLARLRGEERFIDLAALAVQITRDCGRARELLSISPTAG